MFESGAVEIGTGGIPWNRWPFRMRFFEKRWVNEILSRGIYDLGSVSRVTPQSASAGPSTVSSTGDNLLYATILVLGEPTWASGISMCVLHTLWTSVRNAWLRSN